jgi:hypothetical protein
LAVVGLATSALVAWTVHVQRSQEKPVFKLEEIYDEFKIIQITYASGEAPAGLGELAGITGGTCTDMIAVLPREVDSKRAVEARFKVFQARCSRFADHSRSPNTIWSPDKTLKINVSINDSAKEGETVFMRKTDASRTVRIQFEVHE